MTNQADAPIIIEYLEGDDTHFGLKHHPFTKLIYIEWRQGSKSYYAYADESRFNLFNEFRVDEDADEYADSAGNIETRGIPDQVRRVLAELIFPPKNYVDLTINDPEYIVTCPHCGSKHGVN